MAQIPPLEMNMNISRSVYEWNSKNCIIATAQKIAIYTLLPFSLIVMFEAVIKNLICINLANMLFTILNAGREGYHACSWH